jgi:hypothetical protein
MIRARCNDWPAFGVSANDVSDLGGCYRWLPLGYGQGGSLQAAGTASRLARIETHLGTDDTSRQGVADD